MKPFDFVEYVERHIEWSMETFGPHNRAAGTIDHIRKECRELEAKPHDIKEWIDIVILGLDGAWRAGYTPRDIAVALAAKQQENIARRWPDWRTMPADRAIEHVRDADDGSPLRSLALAHEDLRAVGALTDDLPAAGSFE